MKRLILSLFSVFMLPMAAHAQDYEKSFSDWSVFKHDGTCYIGSAPVKQDGNFSKRGQPYLLVVKRGAADEVNVSSGYPYPAGKDIYATIGASEFQLFTKGEVAWAYDEAADREIVTAMKAGSSMVVKGKSQKGTWSEDTYSLSGISAAYDYMTANCK